MPATRRKSARSWTAAGEGGGHTPLSHRPDSFALSIHSKAVPAPFPAIHRTPRRFAPDIRQLPSSTLAFSLPASVLRYKELLQFLQPRLQVLKLSVLAGDGLLDRKSTRLNS